MGERGSRPVRFHTPLPKAVLEDTVLKIPGVGWEPGVVTCSWDVAWRVGELLKIEVPPAPVDAGFDAPGLDEYQQLGLSNILYPYQKDAVLFLGRRAWGEVALPMRAGKTLVAIAAAILIGAARVLITTTSGAKWPWIDELIRWTKEDVLFLDGRQGHEARVWCRTCFGTGVVAGGWCPDCRALNGQSYGYTIHLVRNVSLPVSDLKPIYHEGSGMRLNLLGEYGPKYPAPTTIDRAFAAGRYCCSVHPFVRSDDPTLYCAICQQELDARIRKARFIVCNYEILIGQDMTAAGADLGVRPDLPGQAEFLRRLPIDVGIVDEGHTVAGRSTKARRGRTTRDCTKRALERAQRVWVLTGTPVSNKVTELWSPADIASRGLMGDEWEFDRQYAGGHVNGWGGWETRGLTDLGATELVGRLKHFIFRRERREIKPDLPLKQYDVVRVDGPTDKALKYKLEESKSATLKIAFGATLPYKLPVFVERALHEIAEGACIYVLTNLVDSAKAAFAALDEAMRSREWESKMAAVNAQLWLAPGELAVSHKRTVMAKDFCRHAAAGSGGAWFSTYAAMRGGGLSLKGSIYTHVLEYHDKLDWIRQALDRPYEDGISGLTEEYYSVVGSFDEHALSLLTPKLMLQEKILGDLDAEAMRFGLRGSEDVSEEMFRRLTAHLKPSEDDG